MAVLRLQFHPYEPFRIPQKLAAICPKILLNFRLQRCSWIVEAFFWGGVLNTDLINEIFFCEESIACMNLQRWASEGSTIKIWWLPSGLKWVMTITHWNSTYINTLYIYIYIHFFYRYIYIYNTYPRSPRKLPYFQVGQASNKWTSGVWGKASGDLEA